MHRICPETREGTPARTLTWVNTDLERWASTRVKFNASCVVGVRNSVSAVHIESDSIVLSIRKNDSAPSPLSPSIQCGVAPGQRPRRTDPALSEAVRAMYAAARTRPTGLQRCNGSASVLAAAVSRDRSRRSRWRQILLHLAWYYRKTTLGTEIASDARRCFALARSKGRRNAGTSRRPTLATGNTLKGLADPCAGVAATPRTP